MMKYRHTPNIHEYLDKLGVLVNGSEEEIKAAKKVYRQQYLLKYKQWQRSNKPEFTVHFSKGKDEFGKIQQAAKEQNMKIQGFIKVAVFAYLSKTYLTLNREEIAQLEQNLAQIATEIRSLCSRALWANPEERFAKIEKQLERMENVVSETLRNPQTLEECIEKIADASLKEKLLTAIISHNNIVNDNKNQIKEETNLQTTA